MAGRLPSQFAEPPSEFSTPRHSAARSATALGSCRPEASLNTARWTITIPLDGCTKTAWPCTPCSAKLRCFIGSSQMNAALLRRWKSETIFRFFIVLQTLVSLVFILGETAGWWGLYSTLALFFVFLSSAGITYPNAAALALSPFTRNAGSAAALLGFLQLGVGALISTGIGAFAAHNASPVIAILAVTSTLGLVVLLVGQKQAEMVKGE